MSTKAIFHPAGGGETLDVLGTPMTFLATADDTGDAYEVVVVQAGPGGEPVPHRHPWQEFYLVLEGTLEVQIGARTHTAGPGSFVTIPSRALHSFRVLGEGARFLHVSMGRGAVDAFREYHELVPHAPGPDDAVALLEINRRHGVELDEATTSLLEAVAAAAVVAS